MTSEILHWFHYLRKEYSFTPGRVLEVGSHDVCGQNPRQFFPDATEYIGIDMEAGDNVDQVLDGSQIRHKFGWNAFNTVICCEMLEHDIAFLDTLFKMKDVLKEGGHLIITTPTFGFPLHRFPKDYWRFGEDAFREVFFAGFDIIKLTYLDDLKVPTYFPDWPSKSVTIAAIGRKR